MIRWLLERYAHQQDFEVKDERPNSQQMQDAEQIRSLTVIGRTHTAAAAASIVMQGQLVLGS